MASEKLYKKLKYLDEDMVKGLWVMQE